MYERAFEQRVNGAADYVKSGYLIQDETRSGFATSIYAQNKTNLGEKVMISGGFRFEYFDYERDIARRTFNINGQNVLRDTSLVKGSQISQLIPGIGFTYRPVNKLSVFGGVHRGFAPPRVKDAISNAGEVYELDAESSWNYELGLRSDLSKGVYLELTGFYLNFSNQIIPVSESSGGTGTGLVNGGETVHRGVETALIVDLDKILSLKKVNLTYDVNAVYSGARFSEDRFQEGVNISGNRTPYAPELFLSSALTFESQSGIAMKFTGTYSGSQFSDELNTEEASANGRTGEIPSYFVLDAVASYDVKKWNTQFNLSVKNLTDERYIASRRPQGIRVGLPRLITAGVEFSF